MVNILTLNTGFSPALTLLSFKHSTKFYRLFCECWWWTICTKWLALWHVFPMHSISDEWVYKQFLN